MPELPDVAIFKRYFDATSLHQKIERVEVYSRQVLQGISPGKVKTELEGHAFESTRRHGKYLLVRLDTGKWLSLYFGMTGWLKYFKNLEKRPPHQRLLTDFSGGYHLAPMVLRESWVKSSY